MFAIRGRWRNGRDRHTDGFRYPGGIASIMGDIFTYLFHEDHGLGDLESFGFALELVWGVVGRECGVVFRGGGTFTDAISEWSVAELQEYLFSDYAVGGAEVQGWHWDSQERW